MNLIGNWPSTVAMWFADSMKVTYCKNSLWNSYSCYNSNGTNVTNVLLKSIIFTNLSLLRLVFKLMVSVLKS